MHLESSSRSRVMFQPLRRRPADTSTPGLVRKPSLQYNYLDDASKQALKDANNQRSKPAELAL